MLDENGCLMRTDTPDTAFVADPGLPRLTIAAPFQAGFADEDSFKGITQRGKSSRTSEGVQSRERICDSGTDKVL